MISNLIDEGMVFLREAWCSMIDLNPELQDIESNPLFVQIVPPNDMILLITMEARIGNFSGIINIVYPYVVLEPILSLLSAQTLYAVGSRGATEEIARAHQARAEQSRAARQRGAGNRKLHLPRTADAGGQRHPDPQHARPATICRCGWAAC